MYQTFMCIVPNISWAEMGHVKLLYVIIVYIQNKTKIDTNTKKYFIDKYNIRGIIK